MNNTLEITCPVCRSVVPANVNFCPQCGKKFRDPAPSTTIGRQAFIYFVSFFLAPFGLGYAFKYLKQADKKAKIIGVVSLALTIIAIVAMIIVTKSFFDSMYKQFDAFGL